MGFINQFPYSDAHELNLDWVINAVKTLSAHVDSLQEEFNKISILTEDEINKRIDDAIDENNIYINNRINDLHSTITQEYIQYVQGEITDLKNYVDGLNADLKIYIDTQDAQNYDALHAYTDQALAAAKEYTDDKVLNVTMMLNPITGEYDDVRNVVSDIVYYFHSDNSLTAGEYDALDLTADEYDDYELTAFDYDYHGKSLLT